jgi:hypothetical protein
MAYYIHTGIPPGRRPGMSIARQGMKVFVYDKNGELVAQVFAPDDNGEGIKFQNRNAKALDMAINPQDYAVDESEPRDEPTDHAYTNADRNDQFGMTRHWGPGEY